MAHYIVDASVVIEYLMTGPYTPNAQAFFNQVTVQEPFHWSAAQFQHTQDA